MEMSVERRLAEALGAWLHLEFCCYRGGLFSESSFKAAIGGVVSTMPPVVRGSRVHAEYPLRCVQPVKAKRGAPLRFDFVHMLDTGEPGQVEAPQLIVEAKWADSGHCTPASVLRDLLRLAVAKKAHPEADCILVVAGSAKRLTDMLKWQLFDPDRRARSITTIGGDARAFSLDNLDAYHRGLSSDAMKALVANEVEIPSKFFPKFAVPCPHQTPNNSVRFQAVAWKIAKVGTESIKGIQWGL